MNPVTFCLRILPFAMHIRPPSCTVRLIPRDIAEMKCFLDMLLRSPRAANSETAYTQHGNIVTEWERDAGGRFRCTDITTCHTHPWHVRRFRWREGVWFGGESRPEVKVQAGQKAKVQLRTPGSWLMEVERMLCATCGNGTPLIARHLSGTYPHNRIPLRWMWQV